MPENLLALCQLEVALHSLGRGRDLDTLPPIVLFSIAGLMTGGNTYVSFYAINPNRETSKVHVLAQDPKGQLIRIILDLQPEAKHEMYRLEMLFRTEYAAWEALSTRASKEEDGVIRLFVQEGDTVPFPDISVAAVCVAVEDRSGRMSNFVPVAHLDMVMAKQKQ